MRRYLGAVMLAQGEGCVLERYMRGEISCSEDQKKLNFDEQERETEEGINLGNVK